MNLLIDLIVYAILSVIGLIIVMVIMTAMKKLIRWFKSDKKLTCVSCGAKATRRCNSALSSFVCGEPLCDNCEHVTDTENWSYTHKKRKNNED